MSEKICHPTVRSPKDEDNAEFWAAARALAAEFDRAYGDDDASGGS